MDKLKILEMIENGEISPDEGARLITEENQEEKNQDKQENEMEILEKIEEGDLSIEDGINKLNGSDGEKEPKVSFPKMEKDEPKPSPISDEELQKWRNWWTIPVFVGFGIVILSGLWMNAAYENSGVGFWYIFSWIPLLLGIVTMAFSWPSPNRTWLHVRVNQAKGQPPQRIAISSPFPLNLILWILNIVKKYSPDDKLARLDSKAVEEMLLGIGESARNGTPFYVVVDEGDGEKVEVYIG